MLASQSALISPEVSGILNRPRYPGMRSNLTRLTRATTRLLLSLSRVDITRTYNVNMDSLAIIEILLNMHVHAKHLKPLSRIIDMLSRLRKGYYCIN